jgi:hypothetical protein
VFEREQVARALSEGATFATIARTLGVSRQAVHRRFRSLLADEEVLQLSLDARRVLRLAREEASAVATGGHIVLAVLRADDLPAGEVLRRAGVTLARARTQVQAATVQTRLGWRSAAPGGSELRALLQAPVRIARARGDHQVVRRHGCGRPSPPRRRDRRNSVAGTAHPP